MYFKLSKNWHEYINIDLSVYAPRDITKIRTKDVRKTKLPHELVTYDVSKTSRRATYAGVSSKWSCLFSDS